MLRLSTKQKREVYSLSSLVLHLIIFIVLLLALNSCRVFAEDEPKPDTCTTLATVKDTKGLDGCRFILVLDNGESLQPVQIFRCGNEPAGQTSSNPLSQFELKDGQKVKIGYKESTMPTICMLGKTVEITCITEVSPAPASPAAAL
ncbi:MAG: hypothetical protein ACO1O1_01200 [Adhaeribacter sp.]